MGSAFADILARRLVPEDAHQFTLYPHQKPPPGSWRWWLLVAGRGAGKSLAGAAYCDEMAQRYPGISIGVLAPTLRDVRETCALGPTGICRINPSVRWNDKRNALLWPNGTVGLGFGCYSPEDIERLRGNNFDIVWWDEVAASRYLNECFQMMDMALRQSTLARPHGIFTTTPKPKPLLKQLMESPTAVVTKATTNDNPSLSQELRDYMFATYGGTRIGRQELLAEILDDVEGALWSHEMIENAKGAFPNTWPDLMRVVVAVDPAVSSGKRSDETGIIVCGRDYHGRGYILEDLTMKGSPEQWASTAISAYVRHHADRIVGEVNMGGDLVEHTLRSVDPNIPFRPVRASRGKTLRAEPIAALYERNLIAHAPGLELLEDELVTWEDDGVHASPNRLDAAVYGLTELALTQSAMFAVDSDLHVMPLPYDASQAERIIEAWRFGWDKTTCIVWLAWTPGKPCFVVAEHEQMGEPAEHARIARAFRGVHRMPLGKIQSVALPTKTHERNFAYEYASHGLYIGENHDGPSVDSRRARLAREFSRRYAGKPAIVISEACTKLHAQLRLMRFGDEKSEAVPEEETGLADALALAVTLIPEVEPPVPVDNVEFAREHGIRTPGIVGSVFDDRPDEQEIGFWEPDMEW